MACPHCYATSVAARPMLAVDRMSAGIQEACDLGAYHWILQGGEPVCDRERLEQLVRAIGPSDCYLALAREHGIRIDAQIAMPVGNWEANHEALITPDDAAYIRGLRDRMGRLPNGQMMINRDVYNFGGRDHCPAGG